MRERNLLLAYGFQGNSSEYVGGFMRMNLILVYGFQGNSSEYVGGTLPHGFLNAKKGVSLKFMRMNLILVFMVSKEIVLNMLVVLYLHGLLNAKECFLEFYEKESSFGLWFPRK
ncbi:hypothetical protein CEXT_39491 [Caerostris extrusa]|uniref:Uncharacterized protein n=1 Tax=Caerostris extrusa TaxID=172846 RepID=A0AAV4PF72_CAEEX|nr:hypothetical protein CEXT_39491 [Caerostris extrusa]